MKGAAAAKEAAELLDGSGSRIPDGGSREYPHQLSGGMRQRALIAMAVACRPRLLIADEPTTALDVTIQAQILELLKNLVREFGTALIMITHDLGVVAGMCDTVNVLYSGRIIETAARRPLFAAPRHPYTHGLLGSIPRLDADGGTLTPDPGFGARCTAVGPGALSSPGVIVTVEVCVGATPALEQTFTGHAVPVCESRSPRGAKMTLLEVRGLKVHFPIRRGIFFDRTVGHVYAVDGVDLQCSAAARTAWSASRAAASPPSAGPCCGWLR